MIRVILVDDHALVRQGFRRILEEEPGIVRRRRGRHAQDGVALARKEKPDVVLMDMSMPDANGIHAAREILRDRPETKILVLSMYSDAQYVRSALDAGVSGYILKSALETDLTRAVRAVAGGQQYLSPELSHVLIRALQGEAGRAGEARRLRSADAAREAGPAADRARQVEQGDRGAARSLGQHRGRAPGQSDEHARRTQGRRTRALRRAQGPRVAGVGRCSRCRM